jgi:crotonobetainyl-CoA:carnitine CoA-transferase CaiB-like acyl-CoA transferase
MEPCLRSYRALDLTDEKGFLCGRILADLGCDVIKVEKPGGDSARSIGPFYQDIPDREKSLYWFAYNANKRGITLNLQTADGRELFKKLLKTTDFVIESFRPGYLDELGLGYKDLRILNPGLIMISMTPFGQEGPYRHFKAPDIVAMAMGGSMYGCGEEDRPPVRIGLSQAYLHAGVEGASAGLMALFWREETGEGQYVDVSTQECIAWTLMIAQQAWDLARTNTGRAGIYRKLVNGILRRQIWPCRDGHVTFTLFGGLPGAKTNRALVQWMDHQGLAAEFLRRMDWEAFDLAKVSQEEVDRICDPISKFFLARTKQELYAGARERHIQLYPVSSAKDIAEDVQLKSREFWAEVEHPELGIRLLYPGPFVRFSQTPLQKGSRAPRIGEHNEDIYVKELHLSPEALVSLMQGGVL